MKLTFIFQSDATEIWRMPSQPAHPRTEASPRLGGNLRGHLPRDANALTPDNKTSGITGRSLRLSVRARECSPNLSFAGPSEIAPNHCRAPAVSATVGQQQFSRPHPMTQGAAAISSPSEFALLRRFCSEYCQNPSCEPRSCEPWENGLRNYRAVSS